MHLLCSSFFQFLQLQAADSDRARFPTVAMYALSALAAPQLTWPRWGAVRAVELLGPQAGVPCARCPPGLAWQRRGGQAGWLAHPALLGQTFLAFILKWWCQAALSTRFISAGCTLPSSHRYPAWPSPIRCLLPSGICFPKSFCLPSASCLLICSISSALWCNSFQVKCINKQILLSHHLREEFAVAADTGR